MSWRIFGCFLALVLIAGGCGSAGDKSMSALERGGATPRPAVEADAASGADRLATYNREQDRLIIKNGTLSLLVDDTDSALEQAASIAGKHGGYVISSESHRGGGATTAAITIAVESAQFEAAMTYLRAVGRQVLDEVATGEDVTDEYVDQESRLRSLEATRDRIMSFMEQTASVDEALQVNEELAKIEEQIEQVKGRMNYLSGRAAFSTITARLQEEAPPPAKKSSRGWSPRRALESAWDAQKTLARLLIDAAIWLVVFLGPYLVIAALIGLGLYRRLPRRARAAPPPEDRDG